MKAIARDQIQEVVVVEWEQKEDQEGIARHLLR